MDAGVTGKRLVAELEFGIDAYGEFLGGEFIEIRDFVRCRAFLVDFEKRYPDGAASSIQLQADINEALVGLVGREPISQGAAILAALVMGFRVSILPGGLHRVESPR